MKRLNKKIKGKRIEKKIHELLSSIYRADFRTGQIKVFYNGNLLEFEEVEPYVDAKGTKWKKDIDFTIDEYFEVGGKNNKIPKQVENFENDKKSKSISVDYTYTDAAYSWG